MEQALVRLIKSIFDSVVREDYATTEDDDIKTIDQMLGNAELALHPEARNELAEYLGQIRRPY